jgi:ferredoxin
MFYNHPDECVDCEACIPKCPIEAIFYEDNVPTPWLHYIELNAKRSKECPPALSRPVDRLNPADHAGWSGAGVRISLD